MSVNNSIFTLWKLRAAEGSVEPWLKGVTLAFGGGMVIFFLPVLLLVPFRIQLPRALDMLLRWGPGGGEQYEEMLGVVYVVWGYFLIRAARDPWANELFMDFTASANIAHIGLMIAMAVMNNGDRLHLLGDILIFGLALGPFVYVWRSAKSKRILSPQ